MIAQVVRIGVAKHRVSTFKYILLGLLAGAYIAFGGLLSTMATAGIGGIGLDNPFVPRLLGAMLFPIGLIFVILVGAELFTGNTAMLIPAAVQRQIPRLFVLKHWLIVFLANCLGAVLFDYFIVYCSDILRAPHLHAFIVKAAENKVSMPWGVVFVRGIGANWLVCLAVWLAHSSRSMLGKMAGAWWPIMAFVAIGFEHSIANMYFMPSGIFYGAEVTWSQVIFNNLIPSALGNAVGGALFVGGLYQYIYGVRAE